MTPPPPARTSPRPIPAVELGRILDTIHPDPHQFLGIHRIEGGSLVRTFQPDVEAVTLVLEDGDTRPMERVHPAGLYELAVYDRGHPFPYQLAVHELGGYTRVWRDPYTFLPTVGDFDLHLMGEGRHAHLYEKLGAHVQTLDGVTGVSFAVWAPAARGVSVVGNFNHWDYRRHMMRRLSALGVWELFIPDLGEGEVYKFHIRTWQGLSVMKADPYAFRTEHPPATASVVFQSRHAWQDRQWMEHRKDTDPLRQPISIYEVHLSSWLSGPEDDTPLPSYGELGERLAEYVSEMGFTHIELLPISEHPYGGSWGYQVGSYFAPTARHGSPDDFRQFVDILHQKGIGVILDWVPAHFPKDAFALGRFDGTALYEHLDPRRGEHPDWGTYIFNYTRNEVRNFLVSNALFWLREYHLDGIRIDAVASMLYLDYSRSEGQWVPNQFGGRENLEAVSFLRELNEIVGGEFPGVMMIAEESTSWPGVSRPTYTGGLGFTFKWNMGWMHDTLKYFSMDPVHRAYHHPKLTFSIWYAWSENFLLPLSHDEVVHGKASLIGKMPGGEYERFANLRALYGYMWAHPGKQLLFMSGEFGQWREWNHNHGIEWPLLQFPTHRGIQTLVRDLNSLYRERSALWAGDVVPEGFEWIDMNNAHGNVIAFLRVDPRTGARLVCVCNFSGTPHVGYRLGLPAPGDYTELLNTDSARYGGLDQGNLGGLTAEEIPAHGRPYSASFYLPATTTLWFHAPPALPGPPPAAAEESPAGASGGAPARKGRHSKGRKDRGHNRLP